ncbi:MAG: HD domain-containing phosphohydrolase [Acidobacteriota bacterium]
MADDKVAVLCVDDEPNVILGLALHLRRRYEVTAAHSGEEGLAAIREGKTFAVVLSDMRMPGMDGGTFLAYAKTLAPDSVRMLLTGHADVPSAIAAINDGQIFRFLTKPCPPVRLLAAFEAAIAQYRLITAERVLLEQTLHGSIRTLVEVLSLTNPVLFGRAMKLKRYVTELAARLELRERWQVEVAAMLSQLGSIALPGDTAEKVQSGQPLSEAEAVMVHRLPAITDRLLANIPRLEDVRGILQTLGEVGAGGPPGALRAVDPVIDGGVQLLRVVLDFDALEAQGHQPPSAIEIMRGRRHYYAPEILEALAGLYGEAVRPRDLREVPLAAVREGMVLADDVRLPDGLLLVSRGYQVTASFVERLRNYGDDLPVRTVRIITRQLQS